jgi:DnaK suppressor protein
MALRRSLDEDLDLFRKVSELNVVGDHADAAVDSMSDEISAQLVEIETRELSQIDHAMRRIAAGLYGRCESCGRKISAVRLNALPHTDRCINCQREYERPAHRLFAADGRETTPAVSIEQRAGIRPRRLVPY